MAGNVSGTGAVRQATPQGGDFLSMAAQLRASESSTTPTPSEKKQDVPMHSIGLSNVRREAEKYMGELEITLDNQVFGAAVMMQEKSEI